MSCLHFKSPRPTDAMTDRLLDWHDQAKLSGRKTRAETLLALAWESYDRPSNGADRLRSRLQKFSPAGTDLFTSSNKSRGRFAADDVGSYER